MRAPGLRRAFCSALRLLAGSGAEGGPSYPDVRSPELSGGGGEAARAAITRETAPSCHQPSVLLLSGGVPDRDSKGAVPPGGTWKPQVGAAGTTPSRALQIHPPEATLTRLPPTTHKHARAHSQAHTGTSTRPRRYAQNPDTSKVLRGSLNPTPPACNQDKTPIHQVKENFSPTRPYGKGLSASPPELLLQNGINLASKRSFIPLA